MLISEKRSEIIEALKANPNVSAVTKQVGGVSLTTVWKIAKRANIELTAGKAARGNKSLRITAEKRTQIIEALKANPHAAAVTRKIGDVSRRTVWVIAKQVEIELTAGKAAKGKRIPSEKRSEIIEALKANPNVSAVTKQVGGVSISTVLKLAKAANIELGRGRPARRSNMAKQTASVANRAP